MNKKDIFPDIELELQRAKKLHPNYPDHMASRAGIIVEEAGELMRACLQWKYERGSDPVQVAAQFHELRKEAVQTAASCIRFLENLKHLKIDFDTTKPDIAGELPGFTENAA